MLASRSLRSVALAVCFAAGGCAVNHQPIEGTPSTVPSIRWSGTLSPAANADAALTARALIVPGHSGGESYAILSIAGATPGTRHSWHIHTGSCASPGPVFGPPDAYPPILVRADGHGQGMATLPLATPVTGSYHVDLHVPTGSPTLACGPLTLDETHLPPPDR